MTIHSLPAWTPALDRSALSFAGCDYLALTRDPILTEAARRAIATLGLSTAASRTTSGNHPAHEHLESDLARFVAREDCVLLPEGFMANLACCQMLARRMPRVLIDARAHRSLHDAARAAQMTVQTYPHLDAESARTLLRAQRTPCAILTDSVFTATGDLAPVHDLLDALRDDDLLVLDDCHALGVLGPSGQGTLRAFDLTDPRIVVTGTLAKAIACYGGFVCATRSLCALIRSHSSAYVCTTPVPPSICQAARCVLAHLSRDASRVRALEANAGHMRAILVRLGLIDRATEPATPIAAFASDPAHMDDLVRRCEAEGITIPRMRYPGGPAADYFRLSVSSRHAQSDLARLERVLTHWLS